MYACLSEYRSFSISKTPRENFKEHVTCRIDGGLGNQLFMICTTLAYAMRTGKQAWFLNQSKYGKRDAYWTTFLKGLGSYLSEPRVEANVYQEPNFHYKDIPSYVDTLVGYFQSYRYFQNEIGSILPQIGVSLYQSKMRNRLKLSGHTISLHFRIGDYAQSKDHHPIQDASYYERALQYVISRCKESCTVYCFYESSDRNNVLEKMANYKNLFPTTIFMHVCDMDKLDDWEEMILMSCCHDHIISNSSFSWWGAYLNETPSKCVVYPSLWFGKALSHHDTKDLCPPEWTQLIS